MTIRKTAILLSLVAAPAVAAEPGQGREPMPDATLTVEATPDLGARQIVDRGPGRIPEPEADRDFASPDEESLKETFSTLSRARDGARTTAPADDLVAHARAALENDPEIGAPREGGVDPALESDRQIFGDDDRVQITGTEAYPFTAIGQLWSKDKDGKWGICSATLIAPRTIITAAHCVYSHDKGGWLADYEFYPAIRGAGDAPFGKFGYEDVHILAGYVSNYQGFYGSVVPWDLAVMILDRPAGEKLGWLGYGVYDPAFDFTANIVGYPGDKPQSTMWRSNCDVAGGEVTPFTFTYQCDTYPGSSGSAVYDYDPDTKERIIVGVNVAETPVSNIAVRLNRAYFDWVKGLAR